ncbi:S8 family serine peptidase [Enhygromyxa salina]|uniref:S8 family serine peptidase n=1 Tax=Enhygromyxa salina TaxID=215803 RepID=UPI00355850E0
MWVSCRGQSRGDDHPVWGSGPEPSTLGAPADAAGAIMLGVVNLSGRLAGFSSRGPTADGRIEPDVLAPGHDVTMVGAGAIAQMTTATTCLAPTSSRWTTMAPGLGRNDVAQSFILMRPASPDLGSAG